MFSFQSCVEFLFSLTKCRKWDPMISLTGLCLNAKRPCFITMCRSIMLCCKNCDTICTAKFCIVNLSISEPNSFLPVWQPYCILPVAIVGCIVIILYSVLCMFWGLYSLPSYYIFVTIANLLICYLL